MKPAIILSANTVALGVARSLGKKGVPVTILHYEERGVAHYSKYIESSVNIPHPEEFEEMFIGVILGLGDRLGGGVLIPAADEALAAASRHKKALERHFTVACPDWEVAKRFIEKEYTYALAVEQGVPAPKTAMPGSVDEAVEYGRKLGFPCLIKPSQSHLFYSRFHQKVAVVENCTQLTQAFLKAADAGLNVMLQEIIPGGDSEVFNYNVYFWEGRAVSEFTSQHIRNGPTGFGSTCVALSRKIPEIIEPGRKILQAMGFHGFACIEFKKDPRDGVYKLMDVNGRHNLSNLLADRCGINFPWLEYRHLTSGEIIQGADFEENIYWIDGARDFGHTLKSAGKKNLAFWDYIRPYLNPHVHATLDWRDAMPVVRKYSFLGGLLLKEFSRSHGWSSVPREALLPTENSGNQI